MAQNRERRPAAAQYTVIERKEHLKRCQYLNVKGYSISPDPFFTHGHSSL